MTWRPKNLMESLVPLATLFAVIGFGTFQYPIGRQRISLSVVYGIIVTTLYWFFFVRTIKYAYEDPRFDDEGPLVYYIVYIHFVIGLLAQFICLYNNKTLHSFIRRMMSVDKTLCELGATFDYTKSLKLGIKIVVFWFISVGVLNAIDALWYTKEFFFSEIIIFASMLTCPVHINTIMVLAFTMTVHLIGQRLSAANKLFEDEFKTATSSLISYNNSSMFLVNNVSRMPSITSTRRTLQVNDDRKIFLQTVKHVHLELTVLAKNIDMVYGLIIILEMAADFTLFTGLLYTIYGMVLKASNTGMIRPMVLVVWLVIYASKMWTLCAVCNNVTNEGKRIGGLIYCFNNYTSEDSELLDEIRQFSLQLKNNPLHFAPLGFFTLGYKFLKGFVITVVTYLVIMIQFSFDPDDV